MVSCVPVLNEIIRLLVWVGLQDLDFKAHDGQVDWWPQMVQHLI